MGHPMTGDRTIGYNDVLDAWNEYLAHDNHGRGVVLIGHSQGSGVLTNLIAREIDGKPVQARIISAILMGTSLQVPKGADVGGSFKSIPLCHSASQIGCAIAFASFRADSPPPANSRFGQPRGTTVAVCVNPAALGGGSGALDSYLSSHSILAAAEEGAPPAWTTLGKPVDTTFVKVPGLLTGECVANEHGDYLAVTIHPTPGGARTNTIAGDVVVMGQVQKDWGLHLIDANLAIGNLVDIVGAQTKAYLAR
jgi:pimeloyl-ACP methyl ester carboxylesterase